MAQLNLHPENCPRCGVSIVSYLKEKERDFAVVYASDLGRIREQARQRGVLRGVLFGLFFGTFVVMLSWDAHSSKSLVEQITAMFALHPIIVASAYFLSIAIGILVNAVGKVHSRKEQELWEEFLQAHSTQEYLQPIE